MLKACTIGQKVLGFFILALTAAFGLAWLMAMVDPGTLFTIGNQNCIDLDSHAVTWGEFQTRSVTDPSGRMGIEFWTVPVLTIPNWSIALVLSLLSACLLFITPQNIAKGRFASERGLLGRFTTATSIRQR